MSRILAQDAHTLFFVNFDEVENQNNLTVIVFFPPPLPFRLHGEEEARKRSVSEAEGSAGESSGCQRLLGYQPVQTLPGLLIPQIKTRTGRSSNICISWEIQSLICAVDA